MNMSSRIVRFWIIVWLFNLVSAQAAVAGSFSENFSKWLLGESAQAAMLDDYNPEGSTEHCLQCHNGSRATHIAVKDAETPMQFSLIGMQVNHPIGMDYDHYATTQRNSYTPRSSLDPSIILVGGRVTCVSCHKLKEQQSSPTTSSPVSSDPQDGLTLAEDCSASTKLTVGPGEGGLCLACHNK